MVVREEHEARWAAAVLSGDACSPDQFAVPFPRFVWTHGRGRQNCPRFKQRSICSNPEDTAPLAAFATTYVGASARATVSSPVSPFAACTAVCTPATASTATSAAATAATAAFATALVARFLGERNISGAAFERAYRRGLSGRTLGWGRVVARGGGEDDSEEYK